MEILGKLSLWIHIIAGVSTLIAGPIALFYNNNTAKHRIAGKVFFFSMCVVVISAIAAFIRNPTEVFNQFLLGLSVLVGYNILRAVRAIQLMKGNKSVGIYDHSLAWTVQLFGLAMIAASIWFFTQKGHIAFIMLFGVFGLVLINDGLGYFRLLKVPNLDRRWWFRMHIDAMFGSFIASMTAFTVNAAHFLPWYIQWFGPAILLVPLQLYLLSQKKVRKKDLGSPLKRKEEVAVV